jgi:arylsulfatase A-like enzyme
MRTDDLRPDTSASTLRWALGLAALLGACGGEPTAPPAPAPAPVAAPAPLTPDPGKPDVVLVIVDTLRADHLGVSGHSRPTSPAIDAVAAEGLRFSRAYAQSGWTLPSVASLLTGLRPSAHKIMRDGKVASRFGRRDPATPTLACQLGDRGYRTAAFINNTFLAPEFGLNAGFEVYDYQGAHNDRHRSAADTVAAALGWLQAQEGPSFLVVHLMEPHLDYAPPAPFAGTFTPGPRPPRLAYPAQPNPFSQLQTHAWEADPEERAYLSALYDEEVLTADAAVGALVAGLKAQGRWDGAVFALTADHGEELWDHGGFEHGHALWSALTQVPLVLRGPGLQPGVVDTVVEHIDLSHTLLKMAGAPVPGALTGQDLRSVAADKPALRIALHENCIYGAPCWSVHDGSYRLVARAAPQGPNEASPPPALELWSMAPSGAEQAQLTGPEAAEHARRLAGYAVALRGDMNAVVDVPGAQLPDHEAFAMLQSLGYVEAEATPDAGAAAAPAPRASAACPGR